MQQEKEKKGKKKPFCGCVSDGSCRAEAAGQNKQQSSSMAVWLKSDLPSFELGSFDLQERAFRIRARF